MNSIPADMKYHVDFLIKRGGYMLPSAIDGKPLLKDEHKNRIKDFEKLSFWINKGVKRFNTRPAAAGLLALDIDNRNGRNGFNYLEALDIDYKNYFYTTTPRGGIHLYFFSDGRDYVSLELKPGLEIKSQSYITIPGSVSAYGKYHSIGNPLSIKPIPPQLAGCLPIRSLYQEPTAPPRGDLALNKIYDILCRQGMTPANGNRNRFCFEMARFSRKQNHSAESIINYLAFLQAPDFSIREIQAAVNSAYRRAAR